VSAALKKQEHLCHKVQHLSKTDFWVGPRVAVKTGCAKQQPAGHHHQKEPQTGSRHSRAPQKQQKLFSEPWKALPELQEL
jgi:hypothetical protein